jgi:two-component system OmpR family sensor kinase
VSDGPDTARDGTARHDGPRLRTGSLRARTVVAVLVLLALLLAGLAVAVEATLGQRLRAQVEDRLRDRASAAAALVGTVDGDDLADRLSAQGLSVVIRDADGGAIVAGPSPDELRAGPPALGDGLPAGPGRGAGGAGQGTSTDDATAGPAAPGQEATGTSSGPASAADPTTPADASVTVISSRVTADDEVTTLVSELSDGSTITLTADSRSVGQTLTQLRWVMLGASGVFLVLAAAGLVLVVRATLRPLDRMTAVARSIAHGDRGRRLRPANESTEIGRVAVAFDEMLDGVEGAERAALEAERTALQAERTALEAEQRVRAFVSDAAHELRTPVAGMRAAADTLVRSSADVGPDERERLAVHVVREAARASRLIDDMLLMARVDRGLELDVAPVDVEALVASVVEGQRLRRPGLQLRVEVRGAGAGTGARVGAGAGAGAGIVGASAGSLVVPGDAGRLGQVLGNLVDNAARATHGTGTVVLTVDGSSPEVAAVLVADDGPGVPEADRERVFDRLVRLDEARRTGDGGAGLGLPIARGIARAHGGDLVCEPGAPGGGAVFRLTLPR